MAYTDTYWNRSKREHYERLWSQLRTDRSSFDAHWQDLADYIAPKRVRFHSSDRNRGDKRAQRIIDSTARFSARTLQSGLHAGLTSPARPWFKLTTPDPKLAEFGPVKEWLHVVTQRMRDIFAQTNLYNVLPTVYGDLGIFGTAAMSLLRDSRDLFRAYAYPLGSYALGMDNRGMVTTFAREYELTVRQTVEEFGLVAGTRTIDWGNLSPTVKTLWEKGNYESPVPIVWVVSPNREYNPTRALARYKRWASCHFERVEPTSSGGRLLRESGFDTFPVMAPRWEVTGEDAYGTECPGMTALGDIRQLQGEQREKGKAIAKMVNPPLAGPVALRNQKTSLLPGDVTYVDVREGMQGLKSIHDVSLNVDHLLGDIRETQYRIQRAFFEDLFLMLARSDDTLGADRPTAREVEERHEEKLLALGPVLERTNDELLDPAIDRTFDLMLREELLPPWPQELQGVKLRVEYTSIMAQAQKLVGVVGQDRFVSTVGSMVEAFPSIIHKIRIPQVVDNYAEMLGVDPRIVVPTEEAEAAEAAVRQQQEAAMAADIAQRGARAAKDASQADVDRADTVLSRALAG